LFNKILVPLDGSDHSSNALDKAIILAKKGIGTYFPNLNLIYRPPEKRPDGISIEYITGFDKNSYEYYS